MLALLAQGPHLENTGYTTRPNTAAATGMPLHTLVLIVGPYAAGGQRLLRRLLSSLRHVCLFFPVGARPGRQAPLPHILGTHLRFALGD